MGPTSTTGPRRTALIFPVAVRMRRHRERSRRGDVLISLEVENYELNTMVDHGFLAEGDAKSRAKVSEAVDLLLFVPADGAIEIDYEIYD